MSATPQIVCLPVDTLIPAARNARTHSRKQIRKLADAISRFNIISPILIHGDPARIVAGHGRLLAAKLLGLTEVPTVRVDHLTSAEMRAYALADNEIASQAGWDRGILAIELAEIQAIAPEIELTITGFEIEQIELMIDTAGSKKRPAEPDVVMPIDGPAVTRVGDLWRIGPHRLLCANASDTQAFERVLAGEKADLVITDPPFNVPIAGHVTSQKHADFAMASGEMSREQFQRFLSSMCRNLSAHSSSGSLHYIFMDWRSIADLIGAGEAHFGALLNMIVWVKPSGGMGSFYRSQHELVALFRNGNRAHVNNVELGAHGRNRTNVWEYPGANNNKDGRALSKSHPTVKNVDMIAEAIRDASRSGDLVLDPFGGSGTTLVAAQRTSRRARLIEIEPHYCDVCIRRALQDGLEVALESGESFTEVENLRVRLVDATRHPL